MENLKVIYEKVNVIFEEMEQFNRESSICLQAIGFNGLKRMHRYNGKEFDCYQYSLANILFNLTRTKQVSNPKALNYSPRSLKEHLGEYIKKMEWALKDLGMLHKEHWETCGGTSKIIECAVASLLDDLGNIQRFQYECEQVGYQEHHVYILDRFYFHEKYKSKEG